MIDIPMKILQWYWAACPYVLTFLLFVQVVRLILLLKRLSDEKPGGNMFYADVMGYRLEVSWQWQELSLAQIEAMSNGIGSASWPPAFRKLLDEATSFTPASVPHDIDYSVYRTSGERKLADRRFFRNCMRILLKDFDGWSGIFTSMFTDWPTVRRFFEQVLIARAMYRALVVGGLPAFNDGTKVDFEVREKKQPLSEEFLLEEDTSMFADDCMPDGE